MTDWSEQVCAFCGEGSKVYISIRIDMPDPQLPEKYAYTEMELCKECWRTIGIEAAFEHNRQMRKVAGIKQEKAAGGEKPDEERAYWDAQDSLRQGKRVSIQHPQPSEERLSYFALRLRGTDIEHLAELARQRAMKPSELARAFILQGLELKEQE